MWFYSGWRESFFHTFYFLGQDRTRCFATFGECQVSSKPILLLPGGRLKRKGPEISIIDTHIKSSSMIWPIPEFGYFGQRLVLAHRQQIAGKPSLNGLLKACLHTLHSPTIESFLLLTFIIGPAFASITINRAEVLGGERDELRCIFAPSYALHTPRFFKLTALLVRVVHAHLYKDMHPFSAIATIWHNVLL